jgi:DNA-binding CsgD family transcriptional regulator
MTDTSWFTRTLIEKVRALRQSRFFGEPNPAKDVDVLSDREREVLGLICEGVSDADMSRTLQLSPNTVRNHIASLYRKIGVNRRSSAIIWARERGITGLNAVPPPRRRAHANGRHVK